MRVDSEVGDAVGFGVNPLIVVVALWKFGKSGREVVDTVERHQVEIIESRREVSGRCSKCASRESSASLSGSPPVPALVCSLSPVRIWRQERGRLAARAVKPAWPPCWPSSMIESLTLAIKSGMAE